MHKSKIKTSKHISYMIMHICIILLLTVIRKITKDIKITRPDVALMYVMDEMAMVLTSVLKLASNKYILSLYSKQ